ncbi:MAG: hypothetical protein V8R46_07690 [Eubacterium ramulus]
MKRWLRMIVSIGMICMLTACGANPDQFLDNGAEDAYELSVTEQTSKEQASADSVNEAEPVSEALYSLCVRRGGSTGCL